LVLYLKKCDDAFLSFSNSRSIIILLITATNTAWKVSASPYFKLRVIFHCLELGDFKSHIMMELTSIFELLLRTVISKVEHVASCSNVMHS
jgi:hypothetical protein